MKIQPTIALSVKSPLYLKNINSEKTSKNCDSTNLLQPSSYNLLFKGFSPKYFKAKTYLNSVKEQLGESFNPRMTDVYRMDMNKLDGIQDGIKVFKGLSFKEIAFIARSLLSVAVNRGCSNGCSHCYAKANPHKKETDDYINKMSWDDFTSLTDGFVELNKRLGFYLSAPDLHFEGHIRDYITPFHDSDSIELSLKDNNNQEHDFIDISQRISDAIGLKNIFDTSGWTPQHKTKQLRAEKFVNYYSKPENKQKISDFNVSLNPFHALNTRSIMERRAGNIEQAEKFQDLYTDRMANVFFTFTPMLKRGYLTILYRAVMSDDPNPLFNGFRMEDLDALSNKIFSKLKTMYENDLNGEQKYITNKKQINDYLHKLKKDIKKYKDDFTVTGRGIETFGKNNSYYENTLNNIDLVNRIFTERKDPESLLYANTAGIIDANGDYYLTTFFSTYPTELKLNFANKNKKTTRISPSLQEDIVVKRSSINNQYLE